MDEGSTAAASGGGRSYGFEVRMVDGRAEVALLVGSGPIDGCLDSKQVWSARFDTPEEADRMRDLMMGMPWRWSAWAMLGPIIGSDHLTATILRDADAGRTRAAESSHLIDGSAPKREDIRFDLFTERRRPQIVGHKEGRMFLAITFTSPNAARRVWDWVRWQQHAFGSWYAVAKTDGPLSVEWLILAGMQRQERASRLLGRPRDPRRPLRDWRP